MLFKRERRRKRGAGPLRLILSLFMLIVLVVGVYSAYKSFSGVDPLKISPKSTVNSLLSSEKVYSILTGLLSFTPKSISNKISQNPVIKGNPSNKIYLGSSPEPQNTQNPTPKPTARPEVTLRFAVVADSENDNDNLKKALLQAKSNGAKLILGAGDWSSVGTINELSNAKLQFDTVGLPYYLIPGDHDMWDSRNRSLIPTTDYSQVFGKNYSSFNYQNAHFLLVDNSDNYHGVGPDQMNFIQSDLQNAKNSQSIFVMVGTPLYHPSSDHVMGDVEPSLKSQATGLINLFKSNNVTEVIAGDTHFFSDYIEPNTGIHMTAVGAITAFRNLEGPRYLMVDVFSDGSYNIQDTEVK